MAYHINVKTGKIARCRVHASACRVGGVQDHFATELLARHHLALAPESMATGRSLILSDIDGTLVKSSLVLENAAELHELGHIDLGSAPLRWRNDMKNETLIRELAEGYRFALAGKPVEFARAEATVERLLSCMSNFYSPLDSLIAHKNAGHEVVLISGSPDFIVAPFARKFGFDFHASTYHRDDAGNFTGEVTLMAGSAAKQAVIEQLNLSSYETITGFGDTASDLPLLAAAHRSVLVDPTAETLELMKAKRIKVDEIIRH